MSITETEARKLKRAAGRMVSAELKWSWSGGGDPAMIPYLREELRFAKAHFRITVDRLVERKVK